MEKRIRCTGLAPKSSNVVLGISVDHPGKVSSYPVSSQTTVEKQARAQSEYQRNSRKLLYGPNLISKTQCHFSDHKESQGSERNIYGVKQIKTWKIPCPEAS
jgi:hypothetical protein